MALGLALESASAEQARELEQILRRAAGRTPPESDTPEVAERIRRLLGALRFEPAGARLVVRYRYGSQRFVDDVGFVERSRGLRAGR